MIEKLPEVATVKVTTSTVDEWYGIDVDVTWKEPLNCKGFAWEDEKKIRDHVVRQVLTRPEWAEYYSKTHKVSCQEYEDGPERIVTIPRFDSDEFCDYQFSERGGWLSASTR